VGSGESSPAAWDGVERRERPRKKREIYIDAFRGLMALVMVQGHTFDALLLPSIRAAEPYQWQLLFHGSTAPGFLFASGFVAGLPRAPLSLKASLRRARRLLFVLGVGYSLHLPYLSLWKILNEATPGALAAFLACHALHVIAVSQLFVLGLQWVFGRRWILAAALTAAAVLAVGPWVWASGVSFRLPLALGAYVDQARAPSQFPVFPFAAFVLAGAVAGAALGRQEEGRRKRRALVFGLSLAGAGALIAVALRGTVDFWGVSPGYALIRLGGLILLLRVVESLADREVPGVKALALLGHETLLVYVFHLYLLFGGVLGRPPLDWLVGRATLGQGFLVLGLLVLACLAAAWLWHRFKVHAPHEATLVLALLGTMLVYELVTRPW
jgi:uncharacterized membrane protein